MYCAPGAMAALLVLWFKLIKEYMGFFSSMSEFDLKGAYIY